MRTEVPVREYREQAGGEHREGDQDQYRRHQDVPREDRHPEHRHPGCAHADDRGDEVDGTEDRAETGNDQTGDPQIATRPRGVLCRM
jgi:hypothetical protein